MARTGCWDRQAEITGDDLPGQTLGIVGFGHSGANCAAGCSLQHASARLFPSRRRRQAKFWRGSGPHSGRVFPGIRLYQPSRRLEPHTRGMIGERELRLMKPTAYFINVARGELVGQDVLVRGLRRFRSAERRWTCSKMTLTRWRSAPQTRQCDPDPALPAATRQACYAAQGVGCGRMRRVAGGRIPDNILNPSVLERPAFRAKLARFPPLLSIALYSDKARSAGILPAREKCRQDGGATINGCHHIFQSSIGESLSLRRPDSNLERAERCPPIPIWKLFSSLLLDDSHRHPAINRKILAGDEIVAYQHGDGLRNVLRTAFAMKAEYAFQCCSWPAPG